MMTWDLMGLFPDRNIPLRAFPDILWLNKSACVCVCVGERERGGGRGLGEGEHKGNTSG